MFPAVDSVEQNWLKSVPAGQLKIETLSSTHVAICVICVELNLVWPVGAWSHCAVQNPAVRGQFTTQALVVSVFEHGRLAQRVVRSVITRLYVPASDTGMHFVIADKVLGPVQAYPKLPSGPQSVIGCPVHVVPGPVIEQTGGVQFTVIV